MIRYANMRKSEWKQHFAPDRKMTSEEQKAVREQAISEFHDLSSFPEMLGVWTNYNRIKSRQSKSVRCGRSAPAASPGKPPKPEKCKFKPLWSQDCTARTLFSQPNMERLGAEACTDSPTDAVEEVARTHFVESAPARCIKAGTGWDRIWGCKCKVKNVCRLHGDEDLAKRQLDSTLLRHINSWIRQLGRPRVDRVNEFIWFHSHFRAQDGGSLDRICLLSDAVFKPIAQYFTCCHLPGKPNCCFDPPAELPFKLRIGVSSGCHRMHGSWDTYSTSTSDELALQLLRDAPEWRLIPLECEPDAGSQSLLDCVVHAFEAEVPFPISSNREQRQAAQELELLVLDLDDPLTGASLEGSRSPGVLDSDSSNEDCGWQSELDDQEQSDWEFAFEESEEAIAAEAEQLEPAVDEHEADASADAAGAEDPAPVPTAQEGAFAAERCGRGFVTCSLLPWRDLGQLGQLTEYPQSVAPEKRTLLMRCRLHGKGRNCYLMKTRANGWTDDMMLHWLFLGQLKSEEASTVAVGVEVLAQQHKDNWKCLVKSEPCDG